MAKKTFLGDGVESTDGAMVYAVVNLELDDGLRHNMVLATTLLRMENIEPRPGQTDTRINHYPVCMLEHKKPGVFQPSAVSEMPGGNGKPVSYFIMPAALVFSTAMAAEERCRQLEEKAYFTVAPGRITERPAARARYLRGLDS